MAQYKVVKQINAGSGYLPDSNGAMIPMNAIVPKIGDVIELDGKVTTLAGTSVQGYSYGIDTGAPNGKGSGSILIPIDTVILYSGTAPSPTAPLVAPTDKVDPDKGKICIKCVVVGFFALVGVYYIIKNNF